MGDFDGHPFRGNQWSGHSSGAGGTVASITRERVSEVSNPYKPDVERKGANGVTAAARVGVPADMVPPPPQVPRLPNLTPGERAVESAFAEAYEKDPDGMARKYLAMMAASGAAGKFEVDAAKNLFEPWAGKGLSPDARAEFRSTMNTPLHQTANAIAKRAFLMHLDEMSDADKAKGMLVTVGGCGAGKGFALKTLGSTIPELDAKRYGTVWDSAGDQNATENPWLLKEAKKRGIRVTYAYVSADPKVSWADPARGVISRAKSPEDGRMVDAKVFADSYVIGARNHAAFSQKHAKDADFFFMANGGKSIDRLPGVPASDLARNTKDLHSFALKTVSDLGRKIPKRIRRGALMGARVWK